MPQPYEEFEQLPNLQQLDHLADAGKPMEVNVDPTRVQTLDVGLLLPVELPTPQPVAVPDVPSVQHIAAASQAPLTDLGALLTESGWPVELHEQAKAVVWCESRNRADAISATGDYGLIQIHAATWSPYFGVEPEAFLNPLANLRYGLEIYQRAGGWGPWSCRPW